MSGQVIKSDVMARAAIERAQLAADVRDAQAALDACAVISELVRAGYRLLPLADSAGITARPVRIRASYEGLCAACSAPIKVDDPIYWTRGVQGVECAQCGGGR